MFQMIATLEKEQSLKSDHELRLERDQINMEVMKAGEADELDLEEASKQTALEFEDVCSEELKNFRFTHLETGTLQNTEISNCVKKNFVKVDHHIYKP